MSWQLVVIYNSFNVDKDFCMALHIFQIVDAEITIFFRKPLSENPAFP